MDELSKPTLVFTCEFNERTAIEAELKGWFEQAVVKLPNGIDVPVSFWDPVRLAQDLEAMGPCCLAEPGMIIVPKVNRAYMLAAVDQLFKNKYFDRLLSIGDRP